MEEVSRRSHVGNLHVAVLVLALKLLGGGVDARILVAKLEETLDTSGRVLGTLAVITVGERHDEAGTLHPLALTRGKELINDDLSSVGEITELGLPHVEAVGVLERVTILETEDTILGEGRVRDDELALVLADVLEGGVGVLGLLVVEDGVALGEGTTLNILTGDTDVVALADKGTEGKSLSGSPVDTLTLNNGLGAVGKDTLQVAMGLEALGGATNDGTNVLKSLLVNSSRVVRQNLGSELLGALEAVPGAGGPLLGSGLVVLGLGEALLEHAPDPLLVLLDVLLGEGTLLEELVNVDVDLRVLGVDALVHQGLSEGRLVSLVVTVLAVADKIDDNVLLELGTPVSSELADEVDSLDIVSVDVEDGGVDGLGDIRAVGSGAGEAGVSGETDLVVDNQVDGTTGRESGKRVEAQALVDDTLASDSGITVEEDTHGALVVLLVVVVVLDGADLAEDNGVLSLEMRGVGNERELDALAGGGRALEVHAQVVLDVTRTLLIATGHTGELGENGLVGLADDVGEDIETATMGHTDDDILDTIVDGAVDKSLHTRDEGLATLKTETLVVGVLGGEEGLEAGGPDEAIEDAALLINAVLEGLGDLETLTEPVALLTVGDVDELNTIRAAVDVLAGGDDLAEGHLLAAIAGEARKDTGAEAVLGIEVLLSETVVFGGELLGLDVAETLGGIGATDAKRVNLGLVVTAGLVGADEELNLQVVGDVGALANADAGAGSDVGDHVGGTGNQGRRRLEGLGDGHVAVLHVLEVDLPRDVDALGVLLPLHVHLVDIVGGASGEEVVVGVGRAMESALHAPLLGDGHGTAADGGLEGGPGGLRDLREASF